MMVSKKIASVFIALTLPVSLLQPLHSKRVQTATDTPTRPAQMQSNDDNDNQDQNENESTTSRQPQTADNDNSETPSSTTPTLTPKDPPQEVNNDSGSTSTIPTQSAVTTPATTTENTNTSNSNPSTSSSSTQTNNASSTTSNTSQNEPTTTSPSNPQTISEPTSTTVTLHANFHSPRHESAGENTRSVKNAIPDTWQGRDGGTHTNSFKSPTTLQTSVQTSATLAPAAATTNLIQNPSVETAGTNGLPQGWNKGGYGTNTRTLTYPVAGTGGSTSKAIQVTITNYTNGDAKWFFNDVAITGGATYQFSDASKASVPSIVTVRFLLADGSYNYKDILTVPMSSSFQTNTATIVAPSNAKSLTIFHLINRNGTLVTDDYSLSQAGSTTPPPPPDNSNLVQNGNFETVGTNGLPAGWIKGGYGTNTRTFDYPVAGKSGNGARVNISGYASGDAKWAFNPVSVSPGNYSYSDNYLSTTQSVVTAQYTMSGGTFSYQDLATLPAVSTWTAYSTNFTVPAGATAVTIFHLIKSNGSLTLDDVTVRSNSGGGTPPSGGVFTTGAVTFRFDDNTQDQYDVAAPKLDSYGFKGQFYVISQQIADNDFSGYMSKAEVQNLASRGHEIGAHTRTHPHLTTLSQSEQQSEISGSRQDLQSWGVGSVNSFAYPYGEYDATTIQLVKNAGFTSAAATIDGFVTVNSDPYQLEFQEVHNDTSLSTVKSWVDTAATNHSWLILTFHNINNDSSDFYSTPPTVFNSIVDYVKSKGIPVITASQGRAAMP